MTNKELADLLCDTPGKPIQVSMSKGGIYLIVDNMAHIIDEDQACIIWDAMPALARARSSLPPEKK